jgi:hypothetical protein
MERLIHKDKHNRKRYTDIRVEKLKDGTADIVKTSGIVGNDKFTESRTNVKTGYEKALKRAQTMWNNEHTKCNQVLPMLANKWEERKKYISEPFYVQPKLDGVRLLVLVPSSYAPTGLKYLSIAILKELSEVYKSSKILSIIYLLVP